MTKHVDLSYSSFTVLFKKLLWHKRRKQNTSNKVIIFLFCYAIHYQRNKMQSVGLEPGDAMVGLWSLSADFQWKYAEEKCSSWVCHCKPFSSDFKFRKTFKVLTLSIYTLQFGILIFASLFQIFNNLFSPSQIGVAWPM